MSSNPLRLQFLFRKYIQNSCTAGELTEFWQLMSELSDNDVISDELKELWQDTQLKDLSGHVDWSRAYGTLSQQINNYKDSMYFSVSSTRRRVWMVPAVAACLVVCLGAAWWFTRERQRMPALRAVARTQKAGPQVINLPDGTIVTLNAGSKLVYPPSFDKPTRDVYLTGEGYFDVAANASKPFIVHTGDVFTKVLGTVFNIRAYAEESQVSITLIKGKVQVQKISDKKPMAVLEPGYQLTVKNGSAYGSLIKPDIEKITQWKMADMVFDNASLGEAALRLGNYYGVEIRFSKEAMQNCRFTADFEKNSLDQALNIIVSLTHSSWHRDRDHEKIIWMEGEGCE